MTSIAGAFLLAAGFLALFSNLDATATRIAYATGSTVLETLPAQDDYVALAAQGKKHLKQQTIAGLEACLNPAHFVRIHRSYIVNLERVVRIEPYAKESRIAILSDGARLPVSRAGYARLKALLDERQ
jgi:DNA-binding LytR/AlgR family response regulator